MGSGLVHNAEVATIWDGDGRHLSVASTEVGLEFSGQDFRTPAGMPTDYEYAFTVPTSQLPALRVALGGNPSDDLRDLLVEHADALRPGIVTWLQERRIEITAFWNYYSD